MNISHRHDPQSCLAERLASADIRLKTGAVRSSVGTASSLTWATPGLDFDRPFRDLLIRGQAWSHAWADGLRRRWDRVRRRRGWD